MLVLPAPEVGDAMRMVLEEPYGNPSSGHWAGSPAREAVDKARTQVAGLLGCKTNEIVFTSGGSEANNHALKGVFFACGRADAHIVTTQVEHPAVINPCRFLERLGATVTYLRVDGFGRVDPEDVRRALRRSTVLISIMHANTEVGTIQPLEDIAHIAHEAGILLHCDAAQSVGKIAFTVQELGVDLLSVAGHKLYAPKGVGALYIRRGVKLEPLIHGAGHESGRRAGTENVPYVVGLGAACQIARQSLPQAGERLRQLRDRLWNHLRTALGDRINLNGHPERRLPNTLNVNFVGHVGAELLQRVPEIAASTGSACHEGHVTLSPVLKAMGVPSEIGRGAVRLSVGRFTTEEEVDRAAEAITAKARNV